MDQGYGGGDAGTNPYPVRTLDLSAWPAIPSGTLSPEDGTTHAQSHQRRSRQGRWQEGGHRPQVGRQEGARPGQVHRRPAGRAGARAGQLPAPGRNAEGRGRLAHRGPRARRRAVRRGVGRGRHPGGRARARPRPVGPGPGGHRPDRCGDREDPRRHLRPVRQLRHHHPQGAAQGAALRRPVREVQERGPRPRPLTAVAPGRNVSPMSDVTGEKLTSEGGSPAGASASRRGARWPLLLGTAAVVLVLDQLSKWWAVEVLDTRTIDLVGSLRLRLTINYGSAFSLANGRGPLISLLAIVIVVILLRSGRHATRPAMAIAIGMVLGGAFGNLLDRAFRAGDGFLGGGVVDFVDLQWWPVFNLADSAIVVGAIALFLLQWQDDEDAGAERPA